MVADDVLFDLSGNFMGRTSTIRLSMQKDSWSMGVDESLWFCSRVLLSVVCQPNEDKHVSFAFF